MTKNRSIHSRTHLLLCRGVKYREHSMQCRSNFSSQLCDLSGEGSHIANTAYPRYSFSFRAYCRPAECSQGKGAKMEVEIYTNAYLSFRDRGVECRNRWCSGWDRGGQAETAASGNIHFDAQCFPESSYLASRELSSLPARQSG